MHTVRIVRHRSNRVAIDDSDVTPASAGTWAVQGGTAGSVDDLGDAMEAVGDAESLPMRLALARTRSRLFGYEPTPTRLGRFELREVIGRGATAAVHEAYDPRLDRVVAVKVFSRGLDAATASRVMREARLAATFDHPNVVTVLDVGETDGRLWVAMQHVEGRTLRHVLRTTEPKWTDLEALFLPIAIGLAEVHRQGIVHRDVKPENILVDTAGRALLTDFGVATWGPTSAEAGAGGTPSYMSPEQLGGGSVGPASDQFSYCVTLFEALEGRRPFCGASSVELLEAISDGTQAAFSNVSMPKRLRDAIRRGLAVDPEDRFSTMSDLAAALGHRGSRRWIVAMGGSAAAIVAGAWFLGTDAPESCVDQGRPTRASWLAVRDDVEIAFASAPQSFVVDGGPRVLSNVDRYVENLADTRVALCEATKRRGVAPAFASARTRCLGRRQHELDRFVASLHSAQARRNAIADSYELERIESCLEDVEPPAVPSHLAAEVEALDAELDAFRDSEGEGSPQQGVARAEALVVRAHALGYGPTSIRARSALGNARSRMGDAQGALNAWEQAYFAARKEGMWGRSLELATGIVGALATLGHFEDAKLWIKHARGTLGQAPGPLATSRVDYAEATVLLMLERPYAALRLFEKVLERRETIMGDDHPTVADAHLEIGNTYLSLGEFDRALDELGIAREVYEAAFGPHHPHLAIVDNNLGAVQFHLGRTDSATEHWTRSLAIASAALGEQHISAHGTLTNLAKAAAVQERWEEAEDYVDQALRIWDASGPGEQHPELVGTLEIQGEVLLRRGAAQEAYAAYVHAIEICDEVYGAVEIPTLGPLAGATRAAWELGNADAAVVHARRFLDSPDSKLFSPQARTGIVWLQAQALQETGDREAARVAAKRARESYRELGDRDATDAIDRWVLAHEV